MELLYYFLIGLIVCLVISTLGKLIFGDTPRHVSAPPQLPSLTAIHTVHRVKDVKTSVIKRMLKKKRSISYIIEETGFNKSEVEAIAKKYKEGNLSESLEEIKNDIALLRAKLADKEVVNEEDQ